MREPEVLNRYIGWPFKEGGTTKEGIDCLHLVIKYLNDQGYKGGAASDNGYVQNFRKTVELIKEMRIKEKDPILQENDIIYFYSENKEKIHAGIYLGEDKYLHIFENSFSQISRLTELAKSQIKGIIRPSKEKEIILPAASGWVIVVIQIISIIVAITSVVYAMTAKPPGDLQGSTPDAIGASPKYKFGALRNTRSNEIPVPLIYGENRVAGNVIYSTPQTGGTTVKQFIALSEGPVNSIGTVKFNDQPYSDFSGCSYTAYLGTATQNVDGRGSADVHGLRYTAYLALTYIASEKLPNIPTVTSVVEGLKVATWAASAWGGSTYSQNPAACIRDYLLRPKEVGGAGLASGDVDDTSFGSVYDTCAALVSDNVGGTEARFELNYVVDTKRSVLDNLQDMLGTFGGFLIYKAGVLHLGIKKSIAVSHTFNMSNIKAESFSYGYSSKDGQVNKVGVQYLDVNQGDVKPIAWVDDFSDQEDRGIVEKVYPTLGIGRFSQAARLAYQILYDLKVNPIFCKFETGINGLDVESGDIIQLSHDVPAWENKQFMVISVQESGIDEVAIEAIAYNSTVYNDGYGSGIQTYDYGSPPSKYDLPPDISSLSVEISKRTDLSFRWVRPDPALEAVIRNYEIREGPTWDTAVEFAMIAANQFTHRVPITAAGTRTFHIKAVSVLGKYSENAAQDSVTITRIPMGNVLLSYSLWSIPGLYGGTPSADCHLEWTTHYNSAYYRRSIALETEDTMEEFEAGAGQWDDFGDQFLSAINPFIGVQQTFESEEVDLGIVATASFSLTQTVTDGSGTGELEIWWRYGNATPLAGAYALFSSGDYSFRYMQFIIKLKANNTLFNISLDDLVSVGDVFDIVDDFSSVIIPVGGIVITFNEEFAKTPAITISSQDSPLIPKITEECKDSFKCTLYDKDGNDVGGIADIHAIGW